MKETSRSIRSARVLVAVTLAVVVSFLVATITAEHQASRIRGRVDDMVTNAMPSVQELSRVRAAVVRIVVALDDIRSGQQPPPAFRDGIRSDEQEINASTAAYLTLPFFPAERALAQPLHEQVPAFTGAVDHLLEARSSPWLGSFSGTEEALRLTRRRAVALDDTLARLVEFDAAQGQQLGAQILRVRPLTVPRFRSPRRPQ